MRRTAARPGSAGLRRSARPDICPAGLVPSAWTRKRGLPLQSRGRPVCAAIALCLLPKHLGARSLIHSPKYGSQLDKLTINVWFTPNFFGVACGQFPFPPFPQGVDIICPGSTRVLTLNPAENPQHFPACAQAEYSSAQVIHRVLHRMAVQSISSSAARRQRTGPRRNAPKW